MQSDTLTPEEFVQQISDSLPDSTNRESRRLLDHARAWATVFYEGEIPPLLLNRLQRLEARCR